MSKKDIGPWHIVSRTLGKFAGPFSTQMDCMMARTIATPDWATGIEMNKADFDKWLKGPR
jgi:hypothetical protein